MINGWIVDEKVAVVTGGAGILCSEMAKCLAENGAKVAILDLNEEKANEVVAEIKSNGGTAMAVKVNILDKESIKLAKEKVHAEFGPCQILINGAGGNHSKATTADEVFNDGLLTEGGQSFFDLDPKGFSFVFDLNFLGTLLTTQVFAEDMLGEENQGAIVNISSMTSYHPLTKVPAYSAAKAAINNFTQWLAVYFAGENVRVNAIAPGFFLTEQNRKLLTNEDGSLTPRSDKILRNTPMARFGEPTELLGTLLWLCDERLSGFITGVTIPIDGGFMAYSGV